MLNPREKFIWIWSIIGDILNLTPQCCGWPPETFGEENYLSELGKMQFVVDATSRNCKGNPWFCYAPFSFTFIFILSYKIFERMTLASEHSSLGKPNNIGFSLRRIYTNHSVQFRCVRAAYSRVGEDRARPTQVLIASE